MTRAALLPQHRKPTELVKGLVKRAGADVHLTRGTTYENKLNLAESFMTTIITRFENTRLGRQELMAELLEDTPGALWNTLMLEKCRVNTFPDLARVVIGVDPAISNNEGSAETGIIAAGIDGDSRLTSLKMLPCKVLRMSGPAR
jgi:phage terminase large subunit-like protein